jgi:hypothetical protein
MRGGVHASIKRPRSIRIALARALIRKATSPMGTSGAGPLARELRTSSSINHADRRRRAGQSSTRMIRMIPGSGSNHDMISIRVSADHNDTPIVADQLRATLGDPCLTNTTASGRVGLLEGLDGHVVGKTSAQHPTTAVSNPRMPEIAGLPKHSQVLIGQRRPSRSPMSPWPYMPISRRGPRVKPFTPDPSGPSSRNRQLL